MLQHLQAKETDYSSTCPWEDLFSPLCSLPTLCETAILHDMYLCSTHICQEAEFSPSKKYFLKKTCHKAQAGHKSRVS